MKIKVCGMRELENVQELLEIGPDEVGFIFYDKSKRFVEQVPKIEFSHGVKKVGVFVNAEIADILEISIVNNLNIIQLHGDESPGYCKKLREEMEQKSIELKLIKAFAVDEEFDFRLTNNYVQFCDFFLFDTKGKYYGGNSIQFNWNLLAEYKGNVPYFLSGGIGPESVDLLKEFFNSPIAAKCHAIDVNSRFEVLPGEKNIKKLEKFKTALS